MKNVINNKTVCIFCNEVDTKKIHHSLHNKWICDDCFNGVYNFSKNSQIVDKLNTIYKLIENYIDEKAKNEK